MSLEGRKGLSPFVATPPTVANQHYVRATPGHPMLAQQPAAAPAMGRCAEPQGCCDPEAQGMDMCGVGPSTVLSYR